MYKEALPVNADKSGRPGLIIAAAVTPLCAKYYSCSCCRPSATDNKHNPFTVPRGADDGQVQKVMRQSAAAERLVRELRFAAAWNFGPVMWWNLVRGGREGS